MESGQHVCLNDVSLYDFIELKLNYVCKTIICNLLAVNGPGYIKQAKSAAKKNIKNNLLILSERLRLSRLY